MDKETDFAKQGIAEVVKRYVDPDIIDQLVFLNEKLQTSRVGSTVEARAWSEWKDLNQHQDPSYLVDYMTEEDKKLFPKNALDYWTITAAIHGVETLSQSFYRIKPDLSWQAAIEWVRLCTEAHKSGHLDLGYLQEIANSFQPSYVAGFSGDLLKFCWAEEDSDSELLLGPKPKYNSVLGLIH